MLTFTLKKKIYIFSWKKKKKKKKNLGTMRKDHYITITTKICEFTINTKYYLIFSRHITRNRPFIDFPSADAFA